MDSRSPWSGRGPSRRLAGLLVSLLLMGALGPAAAAGATPAPDATLPPVAGPPTDLNGHWAVAGTSGFDITQDGTSLTGTSAAGVQFAGWYADGVGQARFWSGASFAKTDPEDRGTATLRLGPDGNLLFIAWRNEKGGGAVSLPSAFTAVRVIPILDRPAQSWFTEQNLATAVFIAETAQMPLEAVVAYLMTSTLSPADLHESMLCWDLFLSVAEIWDAVHGFPSRSGR